MAGNYAKDHKGIAVFDDITPLIQVILVALLFATDMHYLSFTTGLFVGMSLVQVYFHRFIRPPFPEDKMPAGPLPPIKLMSYAIQAQPGLAWREYAPMAVASVWSVYALAMYGLTGT